MRTLKLKRMGVWALCAVLLAALLPVGASEYPFIGYTTDDLRLRQKPSTNSDILLVMPGQEALVVTGEDAIFISWHMKARDLRSELSLPGAGQAAAHHAADVSTLQKYVAVQRRHRDNGEGAARAEELYYYSGSVDSKYGSVRRELSGRSEKNSRYQRHC